MIQVLVHLKYAWYALLGLLVVTFLGMSLWNGTSLATVEIRLKQGQVDHMDRKIPLVTRPGDELPDYRADYLLGEDWYQIGTIRNTSAVDWLRYDISDQPNFSLVQRVRIVEADQTGDDPVDEVSAIGEQGQGAVFSYRFGTSFSFKAGMAWFASTALGKMIFGAIGLALFVVVLVHLGI